MYWNQDETPDDALHRPDTSVDCLFAVECRQLPVDHGWALAAALVHVCPWMADEPGLGIHSIYVAGSQNGWERPAHGTGTRLHLSRRTKLTVRLPRARAAQLLDALPGTRIEVGDCPLTVGAGKVKPLSTEATLFARYVATEPDQTEDAFLQMTAAALTAMGIRVRKALCGRTTALTAPGRVIPTRRLMLAALSPEESLRLQHRGLGPNRLMGCGIFIPHKGIDAVTASG